MSPRLFPILLSYRESPKWKGLGAPDSVQWDLLLPHEEQARKNHSQSLDALARRGGLGPDELLAVLTDKPYPSVDALTYAEVWEQLKELGVS